MNRIIPFFFYFVNLDSTDCIALVWQDNSDERPFCKHLRRMCPYSFFMEWFKMLGLWIERYVRIEDSSSVSFHEILELG